MTKVIGVVGAMKAPKGALSGVTFDRVDCGDGVTSWQGPPASTITACVAAGITPLALYNPPNRTAFDYDPQKFAALCELCKAHGVRVIEFGNEVYDIKPAGRAYNMTAAEYAAFYKLAKPVAAAHGIELLFCSFGDYYDGTGWSQVEGGRGWLVDGVAALGYIPAAVTLHPYGAFEDAGVIGGGRPSGFQAVITHHKWDQHHWGAKAPGIWVTEYGTTAEGHQQAADVEAAVLSSWAIPFIEAFFWFAVQDGGEGTYGLFDKNWVPKMSAAGFLAALARTRL